MIENLPKGAIPDPLDKRDYKYDPEVMGAASVEWSKEFRLPVPPGEDQDTSDDCVAEAWSYYHWQLKGKRYSRRDLFCRIALSYGAVIRDGGLEIKKNGQATRDEVHDPEPQTPQNMRDATGTKQEYRNDDIEADSFVISGGGIDAVAAAIRDYKGVVFGVTGTNAGWQDMTNPRPPDYGEPGTWGHALYGMGYHMHGGQKCIIAMSSWYNSAKEHHIKQNYFSSGNVFNAWTLIPKEESMYTTLKVRVITPKGESLGVYVQTPNTDVITKAENEDEWRSYSKADSYRVHTVNSDGSTDWSVDKVIDLR